MRNVAENGGSMAGEASAKYQRTALVQHAKISHNRAMTAGAALHFASGTKIFFSDCEFADNVAMIGGVMYIVGDGAVIRFSRSRFASNHLSNSGIHGGATWHGDGTDTSFSLCTLTSNTADYGGACAMMKGSKLSFVSTMLVDNIAGISGGGAVWRVRSWLKLFAIHG